MKGSCWDLEKDPCAATGHTPPLIAGNTHCLKRASISGDEKKRQVTTPHLIGIHIAITVKETAAGDVIQRHAHPTPAVTEVYMIALIPDRIVEGEAGTVRTEVAQGAILELSPAPPTVRTEIAQEADLESSLTPPTVRTEITQGAGLESTLPIIRTDVAQEAGPESSLTPPTIRTEVAQGAILESTPAPHIRHHGMMNMAGKRNTKQSIMRNPLANCLLILLKMMQKRNTRSITKSSRGKAGVQAEMTNLRVTVGNITRRRNTRGRVGDIIVRRGWGKNSPVLITIASDSDSADPSEPSTSNICAADSTVTIENSATETQPLMSRFLDMEQESTAGTGCSSVGDAGNHPQTD